MLTFSVVDCQANPDLNEKSKFGPNQNRHSTDNLFLKKGLWQFQVKSIACYHLFLYIKLTKPLNVHTTYRSCGEFRRA
ncbi:MAG: hypothetical protein Tsb009_20740 [Planctomycetaceae bacterium]